MKAHPEAEFLLEGHCDERGTREYNLALGDRRANATKDYLASLGVDPAKLKTISYGKERPFVEGHDESAWSKNRRTHFVQTKK
jgi:peptidoglycan-associated lipoprotein